MAENQTQEEMGKEPPPYGTWLEMWTKVETQGEALETLRKQNLELQAKVEVLMKLRDEKPDGTRKD
jgi:hypothetical protein